MVRASIRGRLSIAASSTNEDEKLEEMRMSPRKVVEKRAREEAPSVAAADPSHLGIEAVGSVNALRIVMEAEPRKDSIDDADRKGAAQAQPEVVVHCIVIARI